MMPVNMTRWVHSPHTWIAGAVIGIAGAVGAFVGVLVNRAFRQSFLTYHDADATYLAYYARCVRLM